VALVGGGEESILQCVVDHVGFVKADDNLCPRVGAPNPLEPFLHAIRQHFYLIALELAEAVNNLAQHWHAAIELEL
jgi:hypothetical protein